jgi:hypothetical protein
VTHTVLRFDPASVDESCDLTLRPAFDREPFENLPDHSDIFLRSRHKKYPIGLQAFTFPGLQPLSPPRASTSRRLKPYLCLRRKHLDGQLTTVFSRHGSLEGLD